MEFNYPEAVGKIKEIDAIYKMNDVVNPMSDAENLEKDLFTGTATENGIARREKLYGITAKDTDTLEDRRYRVLTKENSEIPYTIRSLKRKLETLCGENGVTIELTDEKITVKVALARKGMYEDAAKMLEEIVPLNLLTECLQMYNTWEMLESYTWGELENRTWEQLRSEVLK